ncbi:MAG: fibrobacter succinogenes major paralogous domain-containing protein [Fibrobacter sp.]|nr:fibrobacter succinogenes major paralogous domain-containing protein [Fibrobacter sp.]
MAINEGLWKMKSPFRKIAFGILLASVASAFVACGDSNSGTSADDVGIESSSSALEESSSSVVAALSSSSSVEEQFAFNPEIEYGTLIDERDGQHYRTVVIGEQTWMAENLNYADSVKTPSLKDRIWCRHNDEKQCDVLGHYYTWAAAIDSVALANNPENPQTCGYMELCDLLRKQSSFDASDKKVQGICPSGWHLPSEADWETLIATVGGSNYITISGNRSVSRALRSRSGWEYGNGIDSYGFSALPAGGRGSVFSGEGVQANFWSASDVDGLIVREYKTVYGLHLDNAQFELGDSFDKSYGYSIRCLKD